MRLEDIPDISDYSVTSLENIPDIPAPVTERKSLFDATVGHIAPNAPKGKNLWQWAGGGLEGALSAANQLTWMVPSIVSGLSAAAGGATKEEAYQEMADTVNRLSYQPQSDAGKYVASQLLHPIHALFGSEPVQDIMKTGGQIAAMSPAGGQPGTVQRNITEIVGENAPLFMTGMIAKPIVHSAKMGAAKVGDAFSLHGLENVLETGQPTLAQAPVTPIKTTAAQARKARANAKGMTASGAEQLAFEGIKPGKKAAKLEDIPEVPPVNENQLDLFAPVKEEKNVTQKANIEEQPLPKLGDNVLVFRPKGTTDPYTKIRASLSEQTNIHPSDIDIVEAVPKPADTSQFGNQMGASLQSILKDWHEENRSIGQIPDPFGDGIITDIRLKKGTPETHINYGMTIDRQSGKPRPNAQVVLFQPKYELEVFNSNRGWERIERIYSDAEAIEWLNKYNNLFSGRQKPGKIEQVPAPQTTVASTKPIVTVRAQKPDVKGMTQTLLRMGWQGKELWGMKPEEMQALIDKASKPHEADAATIARAQELAAQVDAQARLGINATQGQKVIEGVKQERASAVAVNEQPAEYLYHATNKDALRGIFDEGLDPLQSGAYEWGDSLGPRISLSGDQAVAGEFGNVMLRVNKARLEEAELLDMIHKSGTHEAHYFKNIKPEDIEVLTKEGEWIPLKGEKKAGADDAGSIQLLKQDDEIPPRPAELDAIEKELEADQVEPTPKSAADAFAKELDAPTDIPANQKAARLQLLRERMSAHQKQFNAGMEKRVPQRKIVRGKKEKADKAAIEDLDSTPEAALDNMLDETSQAYWEQKLAEEGMPDDLPLSDAMKDDMVIDRDPFTTDRGRRELTFDMLGGQQLYENAVRLIADSPTVQNVARLAKVAAMQGVRTLGEFRVKAKQVLGDLFDSVAQHLRSAWEAAKAWNNEVGAVVINKKEPFYSKLEEAVTLKMRMNMPIDQLRKTMLNNGVTVDEFNMVLGHLKGNVTRKQVLDEIAVSKTRFEDVVLGAVSLDDIAMELYGKPYKELDSSLKHSVYYESTGRGPQFEQWSEPGYVPGSYRELFVTAPGCGNKKPIKFLDAEAAVIDFRKNTLLSDTLSVREWSRQEAELKRSTGLTIDEYNNYAYQTENWRDGHGAYSDIQNPIVRIRFNERDVNGKKVLFVEEFQGPNPENQAKMPESLRSRIYDIGVKRVVSYAKENGFDEIAWTTGKMQADRYRLEKHIDELTIVKAPDGSYKIKASKNGDTVIRERVETASELADYIGKDLATKAIKQIESVDNAKLKSKEAELNEGLKSVRAAIDEINAAVHERGIDGLDEAFAAKKMPSSEYYTRLANSDFLPSNRMTAAENSRLSNLRDVERNLKNQIELNKFIRVKFQGLDLKVGGEGLKRLYDETIPGLMKKYGRSDTQSSTIKVYPFMYNIYEPSEAARVFPSVYTPNKPWLTEIISRDGEEILDVLAFSTKEAATQYVVDRSSTNNVQSIKVSNAPNSFTMYSGIDITKLPEVLRAFKGNITEATKFIKDRATKVTEQQRARQNAPGKDIIAQITGESGEHALLDNRPVSERRIVKLMRSIGDPLFRYAGTPHEKIILEAIDAQSIEGFNTANNKVALNAIEAGLSPAERVNIRQVLEGKPAVTPRAAERAQMARAWLDAMRVRYQDFLKGQIIKGLPENEGRIFKYIIETGDYLGSKQLEWEIYKETGKRTPYDRIIRKIKEYDEVDSWGIDDYVPKVELGTIVLKDAHGNIVAHASNQKDAIEKATRYWESAEKPTDLKMDLDPSLYQDLRASLPAKAYHSVAKKLSAAIQEQVAGLNKEAAQQLAYKAMKKEFSVNPPDVFSPYAEPRRDILRGEEDIIPVLHHYSRMMERKMAYDPVIADIRKTLNSSSKDIKIDKTLREDLEALVKDLKGNYTRQDRILDGALDELFKTANQYLGTDITAPAFSYTRALGQFRKGSANAKLGYRLVATGVNRLSGGLHTLTKTGVRTFAEGRKFLDTPEGKSLIKEVESRLGTMIIDEAADMRPTTELWKPLGTYQAIEVMNRTECIAANYLFGKKQGMTHEAAREFAVKQNKIQQFVYNVVALPGWMRGPLARTIFQFKPYLLKEAQFVSSLKGAEWARYFTGVMLLGGPRAILSTLKSLPIIGLIAGWDTLDEAMNKGPWLSKISRGIPGFLGLDISAASSPQFPMSPEDALGPSLSLLADIITFAADMAKGIDVGSKDAAKIMTDYVVVANTVKEAIDLAIDGDGWVKNANGQRLYNVYDVGGTTAEQSLDLGSYVFARQVLGAKPLEMTRMQLADSITRKRDKVDEQNRSIAIRELGAYLVHGKNPPEDLWRHAIELGTTADSIVQNVQYRLLDPRTRALLRAELRKKANVLESYPVVEDSISPSDAMVPSRRQRFLKNSGILQE